MTIAARTPIQIMCLSRLAVADSWAIAFAMKATQVQTNEKKVATNAPMQTAKMMVMRISIFSSFLQYKDKDFRGHPGEHGASGAAPNPP